MCNPNKGCWRANIRLVGDCLLIWFGVSFCSGILLVDFRVAGKNQCLMALPTQVAALPALHPVVPDGTECMGSAPT